MRFVMTALIATVCACGVDVTDPYGELDPTCAWVFFADHDSDGFGTNEDTVTACEPPAGYVPMSGDCDDNDAAANPDGSEICDGVDNDCDGLVDVDDPGVDLDTVATFYRDSDGDGFGNPSVDIDGCDMPVGYVNNADDCDDYDSSAHPGGTEVCDGSDNDCDGLWDDDDDDIDLGSAGTYYADDDGDGYGAGDPVVACDRPYYHAEQSGDCDDDASDVNPGADEICDGADNDCDDVVDAASCDAYAGAYDGSFQLSATERVGSYIVNQMTCSGTIAVDVAVAVSPAVQGSYDCIYSGGLGTFDSSQPGTLEADLNLDGTVSGRITHDYGYNLTRSYSFTGAIVDDQLDASGTGSLLPHPQSAVPWEVEFSFSVN